MNEKILIQVDTFIQGQDTIDLTIECLKRVRLHIDPPHEYFAVEKNHRIKFSEWVKNNIEDNFVGILSDCDEIISHNVVNYIGSVQDVIRLDLKMFYFAADNQSYLHPWNRLVKIFHKENLQDFDFQTIREMWTEKVIEDIGWHFSSFGGIDPTLT